jgi:hypothetical protein
MKFDTFLATVGDWGRFQKVKYTLICLTYMLPPIMVYTYTFTAAVPSFRCQNPDLLANDQYNEMSNELFKQRYAPTSNQCNKEQTHLSLKECQRCFIQSTASINQSMGNSPLHKCDKFVFDKLYYEHTLVEEVSQSIVKISYIHDCV